MNFIIFEYFHLLTLLTLIFCSYDFNRTWVVHTDDWRAHARADIALKIDTEILRKLIVPNKLLS